MNNFDGLDKRNRCCDDITVTCSDTDVAFKMRPAAFMEYAQELAFRAADILHFGYYQLEVHHSAWVLSRMHIRINSLPKWRDEVQLYTWHKGLEGLFFLRDFELKSKGDEDFSDKTKSGILCTTSWIVMNTEARRLVRTEEVLSMVPESTQCPDDAIKEPCPKIVMPKDAQPELVTEHKVAYSDIDFLGHTNNARYMAWAMDALDFGLVSGRTPKDIFINFNKESTEGQLVEIHRAFVREEAGDAFYVEGKVGDRSCFSTKIVY